MLATFAPPDEQTLRTLFTEANQGHVFHFFDRLSHTDKSRLLSQLDSIDIKSVNRIFKTATTAPPHDSEEIDPLPQDSFSSTIDPAMSEHVEEWRVTGLRMIAMGKVAVIVLAGGQGTRLGSSAPKGCYDIGLPSHKSLFQLQAEKIQCIQRVAENAFPEYKGQSVVPWYVMTSEPTRAATEAFFKDNEYFGLDSANVMFFNQGVLPAFTMDGKILMEDMGTVATAPDGNGGIYRALRREGVLADMERRGIPYVHAYCVDNCLVKVADPVFIGYCISKSAKCGVKVVPKQRASEPVGVVCLRNQNQHCNHFYTTDFLNAIESLEDALEYHVAKKKIKHVDLETGEFVVPKVNNGIKLELFIFDVFPFVEKLAVLETERKEEFSPLKNAPGCKDGDCPETCRADVLAQHKRYIEAAGGVVSEEVELSPLVTYAGEGLMKMVTLNAGMSSLM
ncbi:nucleotide-diphospho-sugar transferase [Rhizoclosmatium globosum]|uniref:UDP-N-acetylglucosamine diphosphorylase n=1 Tax=Rhizoclosmatium globosum TaxID=329046 RepID=A0A1Y2B701_9FUNG|nr:nucleotide-diphospho-sugar transferase [Rhizoclosmatium globosum]|eukprot:ORY29885.1 nucleotide-diphospho-sugar transferase [Rhizoclosmatium globosum]